MKVPRIWILIIILLVFLVVVMTGCSSGSVEYWQEEMYGPTPSSVKPEGASSGPSDYTIEEIDQQMGIYLINFEGHQYFYTIEGFLFHVESCASSLHPTLRLQ